jgi:nucleoid DNA-binding protein
MNRADLVDAVAKTGLTIREARGVVSVVFGSIQGALEDGETVKLPFGTFEVVEQSRRPKRGWLLGRVRVTYKQRKYIRFTFGE